MSHDAKIRFQKGTQIGSGASGEVFLGRNVDTGELMAIKDIALDSADEHLDQKEIELRKEIEVMKSLDHPNVVRYLQTTKDAVKDGFSVSIIMEYAAGGSISRQLREFGPLEDAVCRRCASSGLSSRNKVSPAPYFPLAEFLDRKPHPLLFSGCLFLTLSTPVLPGRPVMLGVDGVSVHVRIHTLHFSYFKRFVTRLPGLLLLTSLLTGCQQRQ